MLKNQERERVSYELQDVQSSEMWQRLQERKHMSNGVNEPPHLYQSSVLINALSERNKWEQIHDNPILALGLMKHMPAYVGSIHDFG